MTIDKKKLIELLVEKTSMSKEEIKTQLDQLIERILDATKRGKALEIKEFGVFYFDEDGELRFDASEELSTEISFKYAGMKPVELKSERDTSIPEIDHEEDEITPEEAEKSKQQDEDSFDEDIFADPFQESEEESEELSEQEKTTAESSKKSKTEEDELSEEDDDSIITDPFSSDALDPLEEPVEKEEPTTRIEDIKPVSRKPVKKKDNTGIFIIIAIVIIAVLIGGYFYYIGTQSQDLPDSGTQTTSGQVDANGEDSGNLNNEDQPTDSESESMQSTMDNQDVSTSDQESMEQLDPNASTDEQIVTDTEISASETDQDLYGLMGSVIEEANNGYSIVLHSFRNEDNAVEAANRLREDEYRVLVTSRTVYENVVWRVSVGQFQTLADAQRATTQLPEPYNTQNFIQRIRLN